MRLTIDLPAETVDHVRAIAEAERRTIRLQVEHLVIETLKPPTKGQPAQAEVANAR